VPVVAQRAKQDDTLQAMLRRVSQKGQALRFSGGELPARTEE
jgi:hypothetical protein